MQEHRTKNSSPSVASQNFEHTFLAMDLFAGCGGMSLGLENAGFHVIHANEINKDAAKTYKRNFPHVDLVIDDIRNIDAEQLKKKLGDQKLDLMAAGPPCQGFSTAGRRNPNDPRNSLYMEVIRFVQIFRPEIVVIENVIGMRLMNHGAIIEQIEKELLGLSYHPHRRELVASDYGVPQHRKRIFFIATLNEVPEDKLFPIAMNQKVSVARAISDLAFLGVNERSETYRWAAKSDYQKSMRRRASVLFNHQSPDHSKRIQNRFAKIPR